jgi:MFS family permease
MSTGSAVPVTASYRALFAQPVLRRLAVADVCARLPQGMTSITLLLVAAQHASMTVAGLVVAGYTLGQAVTAPLRGRLADRRGLLPVAVICGIGYALALLALLTGALARGPAGLLIGAAALAGLVNPPLSPGMRSLWSAYAGARLRHAAFALDAAVFDLAYITGPVLASVLAVGAAPAAALAVLLTLTGAAVIAIGKQPGNHPPSRHAPPGHHPPSHDAPPGHHPSPSKPSTSPPATAPQEHSARQGSLGATAYPTGDAGGPRLPKEPAGRASEPVRDAGSAPQKGARLGPLRSAALRELLVTAALANVALTATEVALTAYVRHHHALWASGPLLAEVSIGSILGSLLFGARGAASGAHPYRRLPRLLAGYAFGLAVLTAAGLYAPLLAVAAPLAGLCLGPTLATLFGAAASAAPRGAGTETQAWINSIMNGGAAGGAALAGFTSGRPILALALGAAAAVAAAGSAAITAARHRLDLPRPDLPGRLS